MRRMRSGCCARTATGQAAAAPPNKCDELASPHSRPRASGQAIVFDYAAALEGGRCPLWVKSRHVQRNRSCPLCSRKRTWRAAATVAATPKGSIAADSGHAPLRMPCQTSHGSRTC